MLNVEKLVIVQQLEAYKQPILNQEEKQVALDGLKIFHRLSG